MHDAKNDRAAMLEVRSDFAAQSIFDEPLLARAWTLQEALLSLRLLLFFSGSQRPAFSCSKGTIRSDGGRMAQIPTSLLSMEDTLERYEGREERLKKSSLDSIDGILELTKLSDAWSNIVAQYTNRSLSFPSDTMPALPGVVTEWENRVPLGSYRAGLWSNSMREDLIRRARRLAQRQGHRTYVAPSWSWASRSHPVYYQSRGEMSTDDDLCRILACEVVPSNPQFPNGAIKSAKLTLECAAEEVSVTIEDDFKVSQITGNLRTNDGCVDFIFDDEPKPPGIDKMWLLSIAWEEPYNNAHEVGIDVVKVQSSGDGDGDTKQYVRVGMFYDRRRDTRWRGQRQQFTIT
jgi:hypothetical protein